MSFLTRLSLANRGLVALIAVVITGFGIVRHPVAQAAAAALAGVPGRVHRRVATRAPARRSSRSRSPSRSRTPSRASTAWTDHVDHPRGLRHVQVRVRVRHRPRRRGQPAADRGQPDPADSCRTASSRPVFAGSTDDIPAIVLAASGGADETDLAEQAAATPSCPSSARSRASATSRSPAPASEQVVITPRPGQARRRRGRARRRSTGVLQANGVSVPAGAVDRGHPCAAASRSAPRSPIVDAAARPLPHRPAAARSSSATSPTVDEQLAPATSFTRTNGEDSLGIAVTAAPDGNAVADLARGPRQARRPAERRPAPS